MLLFHPPPPSWQLLTGVPEDPCALPAWLEALQGRLQHHLG